MNNNETPSSHDLAKAIQNISGLELSGLELNGARSLIDIFSSGINVGDVKTREEENPETDHIGLMSSDNLFVHDSADSRITGVWLQGINENRGAGNGRVREHDHGDTGENEIIITEGNSVYAGLGHPTDIIGNYNIYLVKAGTRHGSNTIPSHGRWVSIKFKSS